MRLIRIKLPIMIVVLTLGIGTRTLATTVFTAGERNVESMNEAALMSASMLIQVFGLANGSLSLAGTFDASTWAANMSGGYAGMPVSLSFEGAYNQVANNGSYTSAGTVGTATWSGSGTWSFIDISPTSEGMFWDCVGTITLVDGGEKKPDRHFTEAKVWAKSEDATDEFWSDSGKYKNTEDSEIVGEEKSEISDYVIPKDGPRIATVAVTLVEDTSFLSGFANFDDGIVGATITIVPEPATIALVGLGGLVVRPRRGWRGRR